MGVCSRGVQHIIGRSMLMYRHGGCVNYMYVTGIVSGVVGWCDGAG